MKRPKSHIIGDSFKAYIEKVINPIGWVVREKPKDYGIDIEIEIVEDEEVTGKIIWFQIRSSNELKIGKNHVKCRLELDLIKYSMRCDIPIILLVYDNSHEVGYWIWIQKYIHKNEKILFLDQKTITVKVPIKNVFHENLLEIEEIAKNGSSYLVRYKLGALRKVEKKEEVERKKRWLLLLDMHTIEVLNAIYQTFGTEWFTFSQIHKASGPKHIYSALMAANLLKPCIEKGLIKYKPSIISSGEDIKKDIKVKELSDLFGKTFKVDKDAIEFFKKEKLI